MVCHVQQILHFTVESIISETVQNRPVTLSCYYIQNDFSQNITIMLPC